MEGLATFMPQGSTPQSSSFTCNTCGIKFVTAELQRQHMKTDWHRYNLKRRVAQLPSISSDVFAHKILQQQKLSLLQEEYDDFGFVVKHKKNKFAKNRGRTLLISPEVPREASPATSIVSEFSQFSLGDTASAIYDSEANTESASELNFTTSESEDIEFAFTTEEEETESEAESIDELVEVLPLSHCLYCGANNHNTEQNIRHMYSRHGLYIPERSYVRDIEGLLTFLGEVITIDNECLVCGFVGKNLEGIRHHMVVKGHCKVPYETDAEKEMLAEFYNYDVNDDTPRSHSTKKVSFFDSNDQVVISSPSSSSTTSPTSSGDTRILQSGLEIQNRLAYKYSHPPASLIRLSTESQRSVALVDRRYAPGLPTNVVYKQERQSRRYEYKARNAEMRRITGKKSNYIEHFRDEFLQ